MEVVKKTFSDLSRSLRDARDWVMEKATAGEAAVCPCCGKAVGYEQRIEKFHAEELLRLYRAATEQADKYGGSVTDQSIHVPTVLGGDAESYSQNCISMLKHFDLVESTKPGWWKMTTLGCDFVRDEVSIAKAVWLFRGQRIKFVGEAGIVMIDDLLPVGVRT